MENLTHEQLLAQMFAAYPNTKIEPLTVAVYLKHLSSLSIQTLQTAIEACIESHKDFPPTIAAILEVARACKALPDHRQTLALLSSDDAVSRRIAQATELYRETREERNERLRRYRRQDDRW